MLPDMPAPAIAMRRGGGGGGGGVGGGGVVVICSLRTRRTAAASSLRGRTGGTRAGGREWDFASLRLHGVDRSFPLIFPPIRPPRIGGTHPNDFVEKELDQCLKHKFPSRHQLC